ncbi:MAG: hypothetical protein K9N09_11580 [Candidatus Cloacimonetes bacterium]|nr:hypothetical protein [Candidatus Cloacimonadota bacterium]MCF7884723.1 hypothetical protein [Candidatus Cloacimonadota bacterium]
MKKYILLLSLILLFFSLNSQQPFNLEFSLPKIDPDDNVRRVWIDDVDEDGNEEIWVNYTHRDDNNVIDRFSIVSHLIFRKSYGKKLLQILIII